MLVIHAIQQNMHTPHNVIEKCSDTPINVRLPELVPLPQWDPFQLAVNISFLAFKYHFYCFSAI